MTMTEEAAPTFTDVCSEHNHPVQAVRAWLAMFGYEESEYADGTLVDEVNEAYQGFWKDEAEYAEDQADDLLIGQVQRMVAQVDTGPFSPAHGLPDLVQELVGYFDYEQYRRFLFQGGGCWSEEGPDHGVYVFREV